MSVLQSNRRNKLSEKFISNFVSLYVGYVDTTIIDNFIYSLEKNLFRFPINAETESNLYRILSSRYDKASFIFNCINYPIYSHLLIAISSSSNYLTDILIKDPEYFYWLTSTSILQSRLEEKSFQKETKKLLSSFNSYEAKLNSLKSLKRKETLRIGVNDILGYADIKTTISQLSILAKTLATQLFANCYDLILSKYKIKKTNRNYTLIALGKLGGDELNYSSDIDLVLIFDKNIMINNRKEYFELLTESLQLFIESSNTITENGYLYRVDFRLRPDGKSSPLCRTINDTLHYYETRGEDWERQMLIKASYVMGDKKLYQKFMDYLQPFIYPKTFHTSPSEQVKRLKSEIEKKLKDEQNIKLIKGGIRDIEFSVQALQLLNGGNIQDIRTPNTLEAIYKLRRNKLLSNSEADTFHSAYYLYRKIEHYQQLINDRQTHDIPKNRTKLYLMSRYLGFRNTIEFESNLTKTRNDVRKIYYSIIGSTKNSDKKKSRFEKINFKDIKTAYKNLQFLETGMGIANQKQFDSNTSKAFTEIKDILFKFLNSSNQPDKVLNNFAKIIRQVKFPSIWFKELKDNKFARAVFKVCEYSDKIIELLLNNPNLTDIILSKKVFETITIKVLQDYKIQGLLLIIIFQFTTGKISHHKFSYLLSNYIKLKINETAKKTLTENIEINNFLIAGMGSFSINGTTLISDIDLIFITDLNNNENIIENYFQKFLTEINKQLKPFKCDCRLRPEGKSSQLVWNIDGYNNYLYNRAKFWELQSLCKINFIAGNKRIFNKLIKTIEKKINELDKKLIKRKMIAMRKKMHPVSYSRGKSLFNIKTSSGGLLDIDFIIQFFIISGKITYKNWRGKSLFKILNYLIKTKRNKNEIKELKNNLYFLKNLSIANQNVSNNRSYILPSNKEDEIVLSKFLKFADEKRFKKKLSKIISSNKAIFKRIFN